MSALQTRREFGKRVARVHDDILVAAPKHGSRMPTWKITGLINGAEMGTFEGINRTAALEKLVQKVHLEGVPLEEAQRVVAGGSFHISAVSGEVCVRAAKIVAISATRDLPWILDLGNLPLGLTIDWEYRDWSEAPAGVVEPGNWTCELGTWTWMPGR